jgi:hypothetical protein
MKEVVKDGEKGGEMRRSGRRRCPGGQEQLRRLFAEAKQHPLMIQLVSRTAVDQANGTCRGYCRQI